MAKPKPPDKGKALHFGESGSRPEKDRPWLDPLALGPFFWVKPLNYHALSP